MIKSTALSLSLVLAALLSHAVSASDEETEQLYRVELLVFGNREAGASSAEVWEATPLLQYPEAARFLVDPARVEAMLEEFGGDSEIDPFGRQLITVVEVDELDLDAAPDIPEPGPTEPQDDDDSAAGEMAPAEEPPAPLFTPFELLPEEQLELREGSRSMARSGRYELLFHGAWIQPMSSQADALPIVLDHSGNDGDWPRLQGSIILYLSRYLHLQTNLWLNTDGSYLPGEWWLPPPPLGPASVLVNGLPPVAAREEKRLRELAAADEMQPPEPVASGISADEAELILPAEEEPESLAPPWPFRHAVSLQQARRMRSGEMHYVDHPLLGLLIKLTPVDLEALAESAAAAEEVTVP